MPRDATPPAVVEVTLPAGRRGRIVAADDAGQFAISTNSSWVDQLRAVGWLGDDEADAAALLVESFERTGIRPRLSAAYDGIHADHSAGADALLETMNPTEMAAWRQLHRLLRLVPAAHRHQCQAVACWNAAPWDVRTLRAGLAALAAALRRPPR